MIYKGKSPLEYSLEEILAIFKSYYLIKKNDPKSYNQIQMCDPSRIRDRFLEIYDQVTSLVVARQSRPVSVREVVGVSE